MQSHLSVLALRGVCRVVQSEDTLAIGHHESDWYVKSVFHPVLGRALDLRS